MAAGIGNIVGNDNRLKIYINQTDCCTTCPGNNIENVPYSINIYEFELASLQRELDLLRDLVSTQKDLIENLKEKQLRQ